MCLALFFADLFSLNFFSFSNRNRNPRKIPGKMFSCSNTVFNHALRICWTGHEWSFERTSLITMYAQPVMWNFAGLAFVKCVSPPYCNVSILHHMQWFVWTNIWHEIKRGYQFRYHCSFFFFKLYCYCSHPHLMF